LPPPAGPGGGRREIVGERAGHEGSGAGPALEIALGEELLERLQDGDPRDPELGGEAAGGRQTLPRAQPALDDRLAEPLVDLPV
jgi:hypothetical protein